MGVQSIDFLTESLDQESLRKLQFERLRSMLDPLLKTNEFYGRKLRDAGINHARDLQSLEDHGQLPFTTKQELSADQIAYPPYGSNLTFPEDRYTHIHQTSGTTGEPLRWLDTEESWRWWARCWAAVYQAAGVKPHDRLFFAFSFGPFIGFWSAYEGAQLISALAIPGGGMSSLQRARALVKNNATVLISTPTYALHLAEVALQEGLDLSQANVQVTIHAGEPGASLPGTKARIEQAWSARCYDHAGATEVGAWGFECMAQNGVHVNEGEFICEILDPANGRPAREGELVISNLGRIGMPVLRYRTGDHVRLADEPCSCGRTFLRLEGGVIGRIDDALIVRGINVFPSAIENIVRQFPEVAEFAADVYRTGELDEMELRVEVAGADPKLVADEVAKRIRNGLGLRVRVQPVAADTLPRYELKARRFTDHRAR